MKLNINCEPTGIRAPRHFASECPLWREIDDGAGVRRELLCENDCRVVYPAGQEWIAMVGRALRPDGVLSHVMDHRDHRWHADKSLSPWLQYTLSEAQFRQVMGNTLDYHNRWLKSDWVRFFERHGWQVTCRTVIVNTPDLVQTPRELLAPAYRDAPAGDFDSIVTHFVAKRRS